MSQDAVLHMLASFIGWGLFLNLVVLGFSLKLYTEIMKEKSQRNRRDSRDPS